MKINLCEIFGVKEGEEFKVEGNGFNRFKYVIRDNKLYFIHLNLIDEVLEDEFTISLNSLSEITNIIKLPKKKEFTDDELAIMRSLPKNYKWIARDLGIDSAVTFKEKPTKNGYGNWVSEGDYCILSIFNHLFKNITTEDEEPVCIGDYVRR